MALSSYSNWGTLHNLNLEMSTYQRLAMLERELLDNPNTFIDPFFDSDYLVQPDNYTHLLPFLSSPSDPLISLSPELFPREDIDSYSHAKRRKSYDDDVYYSNFIPSCFDGFVPNSYPVPEFIIPSPEFHIPLVNCNRNVESARRSNDGCVSAQSTAARQRRRKITEKTTKLGKLIPGGNKMNTAEMLQAAFKYVKYLQAQVGVLEFLGSIQESNGLAHTEAQVLLASPTVQEKLYLEEKGLVPKEFVKILTEHHDTRSNRSISNDLRLIRCFDEKKMQA